MAAVAERCLVIGGAGMLGFEIVDRLLADGKSVRVLDIEAVTDSRIDMIVGDIRDREVVDRACEGIDIVFQTAAAVWDPRIDDSEYAGVNIHGNRNIIDACLKHRVPRMVYTSSIDVVVDGRRPIVNGDETLPYPSVPPRDLYSRTKIEAERMVLGANGRALATCVIRPAGMYGPRDKYHLPNFIRMARKGIRLRLGNGTALFSHVYSENVAHAHLLAAAKLSPGSTVSGQCYFITDHKPDKNLFEFLEPFLLELGLAPARISIPCVPAYALSILAEMVAPHSLLNRFSVIQTCVHHTFVHTRATRDFGYTPVVSSEEAFARTVQWFKEFSPDCRQMPTDGD